MTGRFLGMGRLRRVLKRSSNIFPMTPPYMVLQHTLYRSRPARGSPTYTITEEGRVSKAVWPEDTSASDRLSPTTAIAQQQAPEPGYLLCVGANQVYNHETFEDRFKSTRQDLEDSTTTLWDPGAISLTQEVVSTHEPLPTPIASSRASHCYPTSFSATRTQIQHSPQDEQSELQIYSLCEGAVHDNLPHSWPQLIDPNLPTWAIDPARSDDRLDPGFMPLNETHWGVYEHDGTTRYQQSHSHRASLSINDFDDSYMTSIDGTVSVVDSWQSYVTDITEQAEPISRNNMSSVFPTDHSPPMRSQAPLDTHLSPRSSGYGNGSAELPGGDIWSRSSEQLYGPNSVSSISMLQLSMPDMNPTDPSLTPQKQDVKEPENAYMPQWIRGHGTQREAWCCACGRWLSLKRSTYWYHMNFVHGITATGERWPTPNQTRPICDSSGSEGLCGTCDRWIPLGNARNGDTFWYRHVHRCGPKPTLRFRPHKDTRFKTPSPLSPASPERRRHSDIKRPDLVRRTGSL